MGKRNIGIVLSYAETIFNMVCGLFLSVFLLRHLGDLEYGLYQTVAAFVAYLVMLEFGVGTVMARNIALCRSSGDELKKKKNIATLWYTAVFLSMIILIIAAVFCANIGNIYRHTMQPEQVIYAQKIFSFMAIYMVVSFFTNTLNGLLLGMEQYVFAKAMSIVRILLRTGLLVAVITLLPYAIYIAVIDLCLSVCVFCCTFLYCKHQYKIELKLRFFDKSILASSFPLCAALLLQTVINQANSSVGKIIVGIGLSLEGVALYSVAQYIQSMLSAVATIPLSMYMPQVAKDVSAGLKGKELTKTLVQPCRLVVIVSGTLLFGFVAVGRQFIEICYGPTKLPAWGYVLVAALPSFVNMTSGVVVNVLDVINKRLVRSLILVATMVLNICLTVFLLPRYAVLAPFIGVAVSVLLGNILVMNFYYWKVLRLDMLWLYKQAYQGLLVYQLLSSAVAFCAASAIENIYLSFVFGGGLYVLLLGGLIWCFGLGQDEKKRVKDKLVKVFKKGEKG